MTLTWPVNLSGAIAWLSLWSEPPEATSSTVLAGTVNSRFPWTSWTSTDSLPVASLTLKRISLPLAFRFWYAWLATPIASCTSSGGLAGIVSTVTVSADCAAGDGTAVGRELLAA